MRTHVHIFKPAIELRQPATQVVASGRRDPDAFAHAAFAASFSRAGIPAGSFQFAPALKFGHNLLRDADPSLPDIRICVRAS